MGIGPLLLRGTLVLQEGIGFQKGLQPNLLLKMEFSKFESLLRSPK